MDLPLSKTLDPADYAQLEPELRIVDTSFEAERPQHAHRRWEYAMALRAWGRQPPADPMSHIVYDVGGAGSPFAHMIGGSSTVCHVIDPDGGRSLADTIVRHPPLADAVFCLSVLEHLPEAEYDRFLYHLSCLVAPGGLLFLTFDYWNGPITDTAHFHWMRERIFTLVRWGQLINTCADLSLQPVGDLDLRYHGPQVYDYTFASLALIKRG